MGYNCHMILSQDNSIFINDVSKFIYHFSLVLRGNHKEILIFKHIHISLKGFRLLFGAVKYSFLYWARNSHAKISLTQAVLVIQDSFPHPTLFSLRLLIKLLVFYWKEQNPGLHQFTLAKRTESFIMLTATRASAYSCGFPTKDSMLPKWEMHQVLNAEIGSPVVFSLLKALNLKRLIIWSPA